MDFIKRQVLLPGARKVNILRPDSICPDITAADDGRGYIYLLANGTGFGVLTTLFALATALEKDELIYCPFKFAHMDSFLKDYSTIEVHYAGIVIVNFNTIRIDAKDIITALKTKIFNEEKLKRLAPYLEKEHEWWKKRRKLTVKSVGRHLIICSEKAVFTSMARSCMILSTYGDEAKHNRDQRHFHYDWCENTKKSIGITLFHWHDGYD